MELIYMYLGNIKRPLQNQEIHFGDKFLVNYNPERREITIAKREDIKPCIYGNRIESLDLLVGQNGTGKSTILDLLGFPRRNRQEVLPFKKEKSISAKDDERYTWFALYHIRNNLFAIEGYWADMLKFLNANEMLWQPFYSAAFHYDLENQRVLPDCQYLQFVSDSEDEERCVTEKLFYVLYEPEGGASWYNRPHGTPESDTGGDFVCQRIYAGHSGYEGITRYLYDSVHNHEFASKMASKPGTEITIQIHQQDKADFSRFAHEELDNSFDRSSIGQTIAGRLLYGDRMPLLDSAAFRLSWRHSAEEEEPFTYRERMALIYLEELACYSIMEKGTWPVAYQGENTYTQRKEYLLSLLEDFDQTDHFLAGEITAGIEAIPEHYFVNGAKAVIPLHDMREGNFLTALTQGLDKSALAEHTINHRYYIRLSFAGISTGEAQYLDLHAALYHAVKTYRHRKGDTCVLLLDEPDCRFHPEWSRNFILNLTELLNTDVFRDYRYQVIISTHSPLLVSDVPKESVHCLYRDADGRISIRSSNYGLMSNLNDLITDSFFAGSVFGAYAERYADTLLKDIDINAAEQQLESVSRDQVEELRGRLYRIEDWMIRESLDRQLRRLEARIR